METTTATSESVITKAFNFWSIWTEPCSTNCIKCVLECKKTHKIDQSSAERDGLLVANTHADKGREERE